MKLVCYSVSLLVDKMAAINVCLYQMIGFDMIRCGQRLSLSEKLLSVPCWLIMYLLLLQNIEGQAKEQPGLQNNYTLC